MPVKNHTLPRNNDGKDERLPEFDAVVAEHGPMSEFEIPTEPPSWMPEVDRRVEEETARRAPEIAAEVIEELAAQLPEDYEFEADAWPEGDYTVYLHKQPEPETQPAIKAVAERIAMPSPVPRHEQKEITSGE